MPADLERFLALVCRELAADEARLLERGEEGAQEPTNDPRELRCGMADGRSVVARYTVAPVDASAKQKRLALLVATFDSVVADAAAGRPARPAVARTLRGELDALRERCGAANAIVIDAQSPVVWGAARPEGIVAPADDGSRARVAEVPELFEVPEETLEDRGGERDDGEDRKAREDGAAEAPAAVEDTVEGFDSSIAVLSRRALQEVRALPEIAALRRGKHVRHVASTAATPYVVHSFAGIYLLFLAFREPFDELRAERAILEALPRIERLVMALPPLDPAPQAGAVAMRRPRRR
ncbi:MAG: hypothetical protein M3O36_13515 [Myxococcota bacterium]|nr:hypothetical protein [Myxococcota bacterium]